MFYLSSALAFPEPSKADDDGLLAIGGDLSTKRLLLAYNSGIFPWYEDDQPILWWSPDPRMILYPEQLKVSKSLQKTITKNVFTVTYNTAFSEVIHNCATAKRNGQNGTWITAEMQEAYIQLHNQGIAISVEVWKDGALVGGLYGIDLKEKKVFCGESMFSKQSDASKVGFCHLVSKLRQKEYHVIDCQVYTAHLESLGAEEVSRDQFLALLNRFGD
ncbi:leucyl/phenylalanyl-tRNA--protein transferase [Ulvibacter litoralis]|uniref:Leucyl/phenylalanyl-tRNA--protein transferase n=1 Tax=Ulvibacter litoralis TaxID=227084 RepID=A0A1G7CSW8_9FLAO|nr:leucyl/phenylalanyl-tRNA--protein transferase [Ulvibacter litoralis]GHC46193.1 leucyl/phenylalanyl-tRNA--protein transferase [Ulvibacter litoralis]SDE42379.1 leucyl/phenylalanyl-tRNA--protein transferase [Ulvibacter litoralis]